jgi:Rrf2 family protein
MRLSKKSIYALRVLRHLGANHGQGPLSAARLAQLEAVPPKFLEQILTTMRKSGLLVSVQGKDGGYMLRESPDRVTYGDVIRVIDGPLAPIPCASRTAAHPCADCPYPYEECWMRRLMLEVRDNISAILDNRTLGADLRSSHEQTHRELP